MKYGNLIIDVRFVQRAGLASPLARALFGLALQLVRTGSVKLLATHEAPLPSELTSAQCAVIYALPPLRKPFTVISAGRDADNLAKNTRSQLQPFMRLLVVSWSETDVSGYVATGAASNIMLDRVADIAVETSEIDRLQLALIEAASTSLILVDGALASDKDVMRNLAAAVRGGTSRIVTLNGASALEVPEVLNAYLGAGGLRELVAKSSLVLLPESNPAAVAPWEVESWGGAWLQFGPEQSVTSVTDLRAKAIRPSRKPAQGSAAGALAALEALPCHPDPEPPLRPKIALVTPMFPELGGPPHSSLDLAMALTDLCELDIWTNSNMLPQHRKRVGGVYRISDSFPADDYDEVIYVLGNHPMYAPIYRLLRRFGGVVIQHDAHMLDFLKEVLGRHALEALLYQELRERHSAHDVGTLINGLPKFGKPLLSPVLDVADAVIVHSPTAREIINDVYDSHVEYIPVGMPYSFGSEELSRERRFSAKYGAGIDPAVPCIISFGEVHLQKGAKQCLFALAELKSWGIKFQFLFVGPVSDDLKAELAGYITRLGLGDDVKIVGAVSEEWYAKYLLAGDVVLQIRQVPYGQVSGALLDAVSAGMHGVASESLARSIEAPQFVRRIVDGSSPTIYAEALAEMIASKAYEERPAPGWEDFATRHDFSAYARRLLAMIFGANRDER